MASVNASNQISHPPGGGDSLDAGATKLNAHWHEYQAATLTNRTGGQVVLGDVCAYDTANDTSVVSDDTVGSLKVFAVAQATIANASAGEFARAGVCQIKAQGTITRGDYIRKSATAKAAESTGVALATAGQAPAGTIGLALTAAAGGFCIAALFGQTVAIVGNGINYAYNADMQVWGSGTGLAPTGWTTFGGSATAAKNTTAGQFKTGIASAALTRSGTDCYFAQDVSAIVDYGPVGWWQNRQVTIGAWVRATVASRARIGINDGVGSSFSAYHSGGSAFEWLTVTRTLSGSATKVECRLQVDTGNTTAQFDSVALVVGASVSDFIPSSWRGRKAILQLDSGTANAWSTSVTNYFGMNSGTPETAVELPAPFRGVARNLHVRCVGDPSPGNWTFTLRANEADATLTANIASGQQQSADTSGETHIAQGQRLAVKVVPAASPAGTSALGVATIEYEEVPAGI